MCFSRALLERVPYTAFSTVEDVEYTIRLALAGIRVCFAPEAHVYSIIATSESAARTQRIRWESGRRALARSHARPLLVQAVRSRNGLLLDLALDLIVPPLSLLASLVAAGFAASLGVHGGTGPVPMSPFVWGTAAVMLLAYVARGLTLSGSGMRGLLDLAWAPLYIVWKASIRAGDHPSAHRWERTARDETSR